MGTSYIVGCYFIHKQSVLSYELVELNVVSRGSEGTKRKAGLKLLGHPGNVGLGVSFVALSGVLFSQNLAQLSGRHV
ncbi:hypothetical protein K523DRAFT_255236 [Schizophyllum commune Tattone D]|nr:hypothetical protein K523DRAFT_255236 [Schizophyllum commune Tattone D]